MSERKQNAAKRRDIRNEKAPDAAPKTRSRGKNTKKWCRGKVGVEHKPKCVDYIDTKQLQARGARLMLGLRNGWKLLICTECGKELAYYMPWNPDVPNPPPPWVV